MEDKKLEILLMAIISRQDQMIEQQSAMIEGLTQIEELLGEEIPEEEEQTNIPEGVVEDEDQRKIRTSFKEKPIN